jgi:hypothetical protein
MPFSRFLQHLGNDLAQSRAALFGKTAKFRETPHFNPRHAGDGRVLALGKRRASRVVGVGCVNEDIAVAEHRSIPAGERPVFADVPLPRRRTISGVARAAVDDIPLPDVPLTALSVAVTSIFP